MPKITKEILPGTQFSRSSNEGQIADEQNRIFRIIKSDIGEIVDIQTQCQVRIGDQHPYNTNLYCVSFDARFEGESRMVILASFNYRTTPSTAASSGGGDPKSQAPDVRPANYTTSTSLIETPRSVWAKRTSAAGAWGAFAPAVNPAGDFYDGVTALEPVVTIGITQYEQTDPTKNLQYAGYVNEEIITLGNLQMKPGTVLFRGVEYEPTVESWGGLIFRGWTAKYEFAYKRNKTNVIVAGGIFGDEDEEEVDIGWDIAVPVTGFNVKAFNPAAAADNEDQFGQPLKHSGGKIVPTLALPVGINPGDRVRAMVKVFEYEDGGASQIPSASPVALTQDGRPMLTHDENGALVNKPLVYAYRVQPAINITQTLGLRLQ